MRLLFVKLKHIGDTLLLTPTLMAAKATYPEAEIWVATRSGSEAILTGCPAIHRIVTTAPPEAKKRSFTNWFKDAQLLQSLRKQDFDYSFELGDGDRGRWLAGLCGARIRGLTTAGHPLHWWWRQCFNAFSTKSLNHCHRAERDFIIVNDILPIDSTTPPPLCFEKSNALPWVAADGLEDFILVHPGTRWLRKRWPADRWIDVCRALLQKTSHIIISAGPEEGEMQLAEQIQSALGERVLNSAGRLSWPQLAGLLHRAKLFLGVDTAAMHLAAACQTPIVALFGPSFESEWSPWCARHILVTPDLDVARPEEAKSRNDPSNRLILDITVEQTLAACELMLSQRQTP